MVRGCFSSAGIGKMELMGRRIEPNTGPVLKKTIAVCKRLETGTEVYLATRMMIINPKQYLQWSLSRLNISRSYNDQVEVQT